MNKLVANFLFCMSILIFSFDAWCAKKGLISEIKFSCSIVMNSFMGKLAQGIYDKAEKIGEISREYSEKVDLQFVEIKFEFLLEFIRSDQKNMGSVRNAMGNFLRNENGKKSDELHKIIQDRKIELIFEHLDEIVGAHIFYIVGDFFIKNPTTENVKKLFTKISREDLTPYSNLPKSLPFLERLLFDISMDPQSTIDIELRRSLTDYFSELKVYRLEKMTDLNRADFTSIENVRNEEEFQRFNLLATIKVAQSLVEIVNRYRGLNYSHSSPKNYMEIKYIEEVKEKFDRFRVVLPSSFLQGVFDGIEPVSILENMLKYVPIDENYEYYSGYTQNVSTVTGMNSHVKYYQQRFALAYAILKNFDWNRKKINQERFLEYFEKDTGDLRPDFLKLLKGLASKSKNREDRAYNEMLEKLIQTVSDGNGVGSPREYGFSFPMYDSHSSTRNPNIF